MTEIKIAVKELNNLLTCKLCKGYYRDAHTLTECMHTFCMSCIKRYLDTNGVRGSATCPECHIELGIIRSIKLIYDRDKQSIVDKLLPQYKEDEDKERESKLDRDRELSHKHSIDNKLNDAESPAKRSKIDMINVKIDNNEKDKDKNDSEVVIKEDQYTFKLDACRKCDQKFQLPATSKKFLAGLSTKIIRVQKFIYKRISDDPDFNHQLKFKDIEIIFQNKVLEGDNLMEYEKQIKNHLKNNKDANNTSPPTIELTYRRKK